MESKTMTTKEKFNTIDDGQSVDSKTKVWKLTMSTCGVIEATALTIDSITGEVMEYKETSGET